MSRATNKEKQYRKMNRIEAGIDVLSETKLVSLISFWKKQFSEAEEEKYADQCKKMINWYEYRLCRLGVKVACAD